MATISDAVKIKRLTDAAVKSFDQSDWKILETTLPGGDIIAQHDRLFRGMHFGDDDYAYCVAEVFQALSDCASGNLTAIENYIAGAHGSLKSSVADDADETPSAKCGPCDLFISHKAEEKLFATALKNALGPYGIRSFVAHEDVKVTAEWQREIERMLATCDAFTYLASQNSNRSAWCQQEIGWAFGRNIPIVPLAINANPEGFLGMRQAHCVGSQFDELEVAQVVFDILVVDARVSSQIVDGLITKLEGSARFDDSNWYAMQLSKALSFSTEQANRIEAAIASNDQVWHANHGRLPGDLRALIADKTNAQTLCV